MFISFLQGAPPFYDARCAVRALSATIFLNGDSIFSLKGLRFLWFSVRFLNSPNEELPRWTSGRLW